MAFSSWIWNKVIGEVGQMAQRLEIKAPYTALPQQPAQSTQLAATAVGCSPDQPLGAPPLTLPPSPHLEVGMGIQGSHASRRADLPRQQVCQASDQAVAHHQRAEGSRPQQC